MQLVIQSVHEMSEQGFLPFSEAIHAATESWGPDSTFGHTLTYLLVILPLAWVSIKSFVSQRPMLQPPATPPAPAVHTPVRTTAVGGSVVR